MTSDEYSSLNIEFHRVIYEASKLTYTFNLATQLWDYLNFVGNPEDIFNVKRRKQSQTEHWMIYFTLKEKDHKMAKRLMEKHMRRVADIIGQKYQTINFNHFVMN